MHCTWRMSTDCDPRTPLATGSRMTASVKKPEVKAAQPVSPNGCQTDTNANLTLPQRLEIASEPHFGFWFLSFRTYLIVRASDPWRLAREGMPRGGCWLNGLG